MTLLTPLHILAVVLIWLCGGGFLLILDADPATETPRHRAACWAGSAAVLGGAAGLVWWMTGGGR